MWKIYSGSTAGAYFRGAVEAETFQEACDIRFKDVENYDSEKLEQFGRKLYNNKKDAQDDNNRMER